MIHLASSAEGPILPVRARAGARRTGILGQQAGSLQVSVTQAPEKGKANKAIIAALAEALGLKKSQIKLIAGETSQQKRFLISGIDIDELAVRINNALEAC